MILIPSPIAVYITQNRVEVNWAPTKSISKLVDEHPPITNHTAPEVEYINFCTNDNDDYEGYEFATEIVTYLFPVIHFKPFKEGRIISITSQIMRDGEPYSSPIEDEIEEVEEGELTLYPDGIGHDEPGWLEPGVYRWNLCINYKDYLFSEFEIYQGSMDSTGPSEAAVSVFDSSLQPLLLLEWKLVCS